MTNTEMLREEVKHYIEEADDRSLRIVKAIFEVEQERGAKNEDWWDELPTDIQRLVDAGLKESKNGGGVSHEEMVKRHSKWLRK